MDEMWDNPKGAEWEAASSNSDASGSNKKVLVPQVGTPSSIYGWFQQNHGLQEKEINASTPQGIEQFKRILGLYYRIAQRILQKARTHVVHEPDNYNAFVRKLETRLDNKIRVEAEGQKYINVNGRWRFDGSPEPYQDWFQSGKGKFKQIFIEISRELIKTLNDEAPPEEHNTLLIGDGGRTEMPKEPETIAVDLDNTLVDDMDNALEGAKDAMEKLKEKGFKLVIYTARFSAVPPEEFQSMMLNVQHILRQAGIPFDEVSITKPICKYYIDDRGVKFTSWDDVMNLVQEDGPQDNKPSIMQQKKGLPAAGNQLETTLTLESAPINKRFKLLSPEDLARRAYVKMNEQEF